MRSTDAADFTFAEASHLPATSVVDPAAGEEVPRERAPKRRADEAFTRELSMTGLAVGPSTPAVASPQPADTAANCSPGQDSSAAETSVATQHGTIPVQNLGGMDAGASDQEHRMVPGAPSGANVIAIEMPEPLLEAQQEVGRGDQ